MDRENKWQARPKWLRELAVLALAVLVAGFAYVNIYYPADETALRAMEGSEQVSVVKTDTGWLFDGPGEDSALIFYPGGKVEETAYAPLLLRVAQGGTDCFLVKMPLRLAVFGKDRAGQVMEGYSYDHWYLGGHSLGGAMAADFAAGHLNELDGLALLAAYPTKPLHWAGFGVLSIHGEEDGVLNREKFHDGHKYLPQDGQDWRGMTIPGGNHAQFGSYGAQKGDGEAVISPEKQWDITAQAILDLTAEPSLRRARWEVGRALGVPHAGVLYVGASESDDPAAIRAGVDPALLEQYPFLANIPDERVVSLGAVWDLYALIPRHREAQVTVNRLDMDPDTGETLTGPTVYHGPGPVLLWCNASDIFPNARVTVKDEGRTTAEGFSDEVTFSPYLSLKDGSVATDAGEKVYLFDQGTP